MDWKYKKVLVAGGAGMIGSHLARRLLKEGAAVTVVDNLSSGSRKNIEDIINDIVFVEDDLRNKETCRIATLGRDVTFALSANMGGIGWISTVHADIMRDNVLMNVNMLESARQNEVPLYFYSSSACAYSNIYQMSPDVVPLRESQAYPASPDEEYGWEKIFTERMCAAFKKDYGLNVRVARFHNVYGSAHTAFDKAKAKAPCHMIIKAIQHPNPPWVIWGDGKSTRSFLYIDDCIDGVLKLMESDYSEPINIGSDRLISVDDLAKIVIGISGKDIVPEHDLSKPQGVRGRNADLTLVKQVLGWEPKVSLEDGLERVYMWALEHYDELENI